MQPKSPKWVEDIRVAAAFILESTSSKSVDDYRNDLMLRSAIERNFEIIGEAVNRLAKHDPKIAERLGDYPRIIAFRNILIHGYDVVDRENVWKVIKENLPSLKEQVEKLLEETTGGSQAD